MKYFSDCTTPDEMRAEYRRLTKLHHPDLGGDTRIMQEINDTYHQMLAGFDGREFNRHHAEANERQTWTYHYDQQHENEIMEAIGNILRAIGSQPKVELTLVGLWVWITGDTRPIKDQLKEAGCFWNRKRSAWTWRPSWAKSYYSKNRTLDDILAAGVLVTPAARNQQIA